MALAILIYFLSIPNVHSEKEHIDSGDTIDRYTIKTSPPPALKTSQIENKIIEMWGDDSQTALAIFRCESGLKPQAINWGDAEITGMPSQGIAQINAPYNERLFDWEYNLEVAYEMYSRRGWQPWSCHKILYQR